MRRNIIMAVLFLAGMMVIVPYMIVDTNGRIRAESEMTIRVWLHEQGRIEEMSMTDYLIGAVSAEMPAAFEEEALRVQAVAARTYAMQQMAAYGGSGYNGADISTDHRVHQAYMNEEQCREKWGVEYERYHAKVRRAVESTAGEVAVYDGSLIRALYHSTCGGRTASSAEVWGRAVPYLVSVQCDWDAQAPRRQEVQRVAIDEVADKLGIEAAVMTAGADGSETVQVIARTESGRIESVRIGEKTYAGSDVRAKLGLRSTNFTAHTESDSLVFTTIGYGHGAGLCQYGADGMAKAGYSYRDILAHYYQGIDIIPLTKVKRIS
ncbi:MAG: stage II sporulation protein D [Selenomonadales bacterium]|nr:stage II sporulation protein D [Selenomonadales bacterium]